MELHLLNLKEGHCVTDYVSTIVTTLLICLLFRVICTFIPKVIGTYLSY